MSYPAPTSQKKMDEKQRKLVYMALVKRSKLLKFREKSPKINMFVNKLWIFELQSILTIGVATGLLATPVRGLLLYWGC